jgi:hypothetical protein
MLNDEPDLTAELDEAEAIVTGRAEAIVTEWGVRYGEGRVDVYGSSPRSEHLARLDVASGPLSGPEVVVRRTVTYGPWEECPGDR